jgi:hypothetical protein
MAQRFRIIRKEYLAAACPELFTDVVVNGTAEHGWLEKIIAEKGEWLYAFNETYAHMDLDPDLYILSAVAGFCQDQSDDVTERYITSLTNDSWRQDEKTFGFVPAMEYIDSLVSTLDAKNPNRLYCGISAYDYIGDGISRLSYIFRVATDGFNHNNALFYMSGEDSE